MVACRGLLRRKLLAMTSEITRFFVMAEGALVIASRVRHCERSEAIPEAKVACRGLLRRKLLAMTSEVVGRLAMTSEVAKFLAMTNEVTRFFAMAEDILYIARKNQPATQPGDAATWKG